MRKKILAAAVAASEIYFSTFSAAQGVLRDKYGNSIKPYIAEERKASESTKREIIDASKSGPQFLVNKAERTLTVYQDGKPVRTYPVSLGKNCANLDAKQNSAPAEVRRNWISYSRGSARLPMSLVNDSCTPEGTYEITSKNLSGFLYETKTLGFDYPNSFDIWKAYKKNDIAKGDMIEWFFKFWNRPATVLGLTDGIHGHSNNLRDGTFGDWTSLGSVALEDRNMEELFELAQIGKTKVGIIRYLK